jgi:hypothetical protein
MKTTQVVFVNTLIYVNLFRSSPKSFGLLSPVRLKLSAERPSPADARHGLLIWPRQSDPSLSRAFCPAFYERKFQLNDV